MPQEIGKSVIENYGLVGLLLVVFITTCWLLFKYFVATLQRQESSLSAYIQTVETNRLNAELRYQTSIEKITDKFEGAIKVLSTETKETFGHLTEAINQLRDEMHRGKQ